MSTTQTQQSIGDLIATEFSRDKVFLTTAEERRLAGMIDKAVDYRLKISAGFVSQWFEGWIPKSIDYTALPTGDSHIDYAARIAAYGVLLGQVCAAIEDEGHRIGNWCAVLEETTGLLADTIFALSDYPDHESMRSTFDAIARKHLKK